jgi:hypothetical protein
MAVPSAIAESMTWRIASNLASGTWLAARKRSRKASIKNLPASRSPGSPT